MRTVTQQFKVFYFDELSKETQEKTLNKYRDWNVNSWHPNGWAEYLKVERREELSSMGFDGVDFRWSGFWSQGDGASFTAKVNLEKWLKAHRLGNKYRKALNAYNKDELTISIDQGGHYCHEYTMSIFSEYFPEANDSINEVNKQINELEDMILEDAREEARRFYKDLEREYDELTSDEAIKEAFIENAYEFTEEGEIYYE